ncbi:Serine/threonine-protein kinase PKH1 [Teratosphaeria destructans]|uniref:non-specific serine/threonine protein kinase n=1 Tax=Teratosphaeria destructans TaxID=418781 RepID=A0A9W7SNJ9_9PEZI|nr:Serine/threonine-protein kinase PKH1 [Teratosphaeria destructans]
MSGDLSLSQSLGGLRIANPDEQGTASPSPPPLSSTTVPSSRPPPPSSPSSIATVTASKASTPGLLPQLSHESALAGEDGLGFNPDTYSLKDTDVEPRVPQPLSLYSAAGQPVDNGSQSSRQSTSTPTQAPYYPPQPTHDPQYRQPGPPPPNTRPVSSMYMQHNTSSTSSHMSSQSAYRYRDDMGSSDATASGIARSTSRSARNMMAGGVGRQTSKSYRQPGPPVNGGNVPLPPRRNSKRVPGAYEGPDVPYRGAGPPSRSTEEWQERGAAVAQRQETDPSGQMQTRMVKKGVKDFNFGRTLGEGSYSTVLAATDRQNLKEYAIKVLDKRHIIKEKKVKYVNIERDTLNRLTEHPGIVRLYYTFQDERSLYFVLDLASEGELLGVLKKLGSFDIECTRFYGAEILDSIAYMHSRGVIHRDLKPENVLLDRDMHVKITDFGTAKILPEPKYNGSGSEVASGNITDGAETDRAVSFVGTAEYVSPELLRDKNACKASDLWAFGCIIYQLLAGRPPFKAANEYLTFQKILGLEYTFPDGFPPVARDLVERLLVLEPGNRLPVEHIKNHQFFDGVQWGKSLWRQKAPRLKPYAAPPPEPIKLNGGNKSNNSLAAAGAAVALNQASSPPQSRPQLRGITELPPPSQLDIDWSPVLTRNNERILKLGNLIVFTGPQAQSPDGPSTLSEKPKFSRFFSGNTTKRRERLVLITSGARLIIAAAGGNEKKAKLDVDLMASGTSWKSYVDNKGLTAWSLDTRDKHLTFEDPRGTTADPAGTKYSTQEWLESLEQAREFAIAQSMTSSYSGQSVLDNLESSVSSPADSIGGDAATPLPGDRHTLRQTLRKTTDGDDMGSSGGAFKGRKRFSKRHSKSGLAAVF